MTICRVCEEKDRTIKRLLEAIDRQNEEKEEITTSCQRRVDEILTAVKRDKKGWEDERTREDKKDNRNLKLAIRIAKWWGGLTLVLILELILSLAYGREGITMGLNLIFKAFKTLKGG